MSTITTHPVHPLAIDLTGSTHHAWTVIGYAGSYYAPGGVKGGSQATWVARCRCGTERVYLGQDIRREEIARDCGCGAVAPMGATDAARAVVAEAVDHLEKLGDEMKAKAEADANTVELPRGVPMVSLYFGIILGVILGTTFGLVIFG